MRRSSYFLLYFILAFGFSILSSIPQAHASSLQKAPNNLGLVGYWSMEDATGTTATDFSGSGNTGTLNNFALATSTTSNWTTGKIGRGLNFDGSNDYVDAGAGSSLSVTSRFTLTAWVKGTSLPTGASSGAWVIGKDTDTGRSFTFGPFGTGSATRLVIQTNGNIPGVGNNGYSNTSLSTNIWYHIAVAYDGTNVTYYLNGAADGTFAVVGGDPASTGTHLTIGERLYPTAEERFNGTIDEVRVYNRQLSGTEISTLYGMTKASHGKNNTTVGLVAYYPMEEGSGTTTKDATGQGNTGTLTGGPTWVSGKFGNGISFDGSNDYVQTASAPGFTASTPFSLCAWAYSTSNSSVVIMNTAIEASPYDGIWFQWGGGGRQNKPVFAINSTASGAEDIYVSSALSLNTWYHLCATYDGSQTVGGMKIYVNGAAASTTTNANSGFGSFPNRAFRIGTDTHTSPSDWFTGSIDDVRIYNRGLSAAEVSQLYAQTSTIIRAKTNSLRNNPASNLQQGLVGWWPFDGAYLTTTTSTDLGSGGNNGTLSGGPTPSIGKLGQALTFDKSDDVVSVTANSAFNFDITSNFTLSAWVYKTSADATANGIFGKWQTGSSPYWYCRIGDSASEVFCRFSNSGGTAENYQSASNVVANQWTHISVVANGSTVKIYLNGVIDSTTNITLTGTMQNNVNLQIGNIGSSLSNHWFGGKIDDVRIYNRALTAAEVLQLYNAGK